jgi:16S rRNA (cytosine1402-N4)-methyltransferase
VALVHANVAALKTELARLGIQGVTGTLLDLGVSSYQLDDAARGFSFRGSDRLDMRMDTRQKRSAWHVVNEYDERKLVDILRAYGEERHARRIARTIVQQRPIHTTGELAQAVESAVRARPSVKTLARVFQAIRIEVNDELHNLEKSLADIMDLTVPGGRIVVISYHSLEDRIVKRTFRDASATVVRSAHKYAPDLRVQPRLRVLTRTPITPSDEEIARNPRARSAKLRAAERIATMNGKGTS